MYWSTGRRHNSIFRQIPPTEASVGTRIDTVFRLLYRGAGAAWVWVRLEWCEGSSGIGNGVWEGGGGKGKKRGWMEGEGGANIEAGLKE